jgi:tol-pal system protein YbgF
MLMKAQSMLKPLHGALAVSLLMLAGLQGTPAKAQSDQWNALYDRIIRLEHEVRSGGAGAGAGGGSNARIEQQLGQLAAQVNAMQQQMLEMQRELNRLRELERQGLLFRNRRTASVIAPQQQPQQWNQGQIAPNPNYGQMQQSVTIDGQGSGSTGQLPRGGLATGPQTLGTLVLRDGQAQPYQPAQPPVVPQPQVQQQQQQYGAPQLQPQPQPVQPQPLPQQTYQPRQVQGVQANTLPPPPGAGGQQQAPQGQPQFQLQTGPQAWQPQPGQEPAFDADGRPVIADGGPGSSLAPEKVETALLDGSVGGSNLAAGDSTSGGAVDDVAGRMFLQAKSSYTSRDFTGAVSGFKTFILKNKDHELADDAQFFLGEAYYAQGQYKQAAQSYLSGYQNYPKGDKRGESLLKLAMSLDKLGQKKQACATFGEVNKQFAREAAVRNASLKEMQRAGCN